MFAAEEKEIIKISIYKLPVMILRSDVPALLNSSLFVSAWKEWSRFRRFGLPHARGPNAERSLVIRSIEALEQEFDAHQLESGV